MLGKGDVMSGECGWGGVGRSRDEGRSVLGRGDMIGLCMGGYGSLGGSLGGYGSFSTDLDHVVVLLLDR